jgi:uncharacterized membrane protein YphA (DoxX/SURF4 family)
VKYSKALTQTLTAATALVWLLNGLFCKILHLVPRHELIVGRVLGHQHAASLTIAIGFAELVMFVWILSGLVKRLCAITQMLFVAIMNIIELFTAQDLLLFGNWNSVLALAFIASVYYSFFVLPKRLPAQAYTWAHS